MLAGSGYTELGSGWEAVLRVGRTAAARHHDDELSAARVWVIPCSGLYMAGMGVSGNLSGEGLLCIVISCVE